MIEKYYKYSSWTTRSTPHSHSLTPIVTSSVSPTPPPNDDSKDGEMCNKKAHQSKKVLRVLIVEVAPEMETLTLVAPSIKIIYNSETKKQKAPPHTVIITKSETSTNPTYRKTIKMTT